MTIDITPVHVDGVRSPVRHAAPPGAADATEVVLMLHGNPGSSADYDGLLAAVSPFARVLAPDMPGFGKADRPWSFEYSVEGYARHLGAILDELGAARVHLVLHDFGGPWGLTWGAKHIERVASVTLLNIGLMPEFEWHYAAKIWRTPVLGELFQLVASPPVVRRIMNRDNPKPFPKHFLDRLIADIDAGTKRAVLRLYRATDATTLTGMGVLETFEAARRPALVVWGTGDRYVPVEHAETQRRFFDADVHLVDGAGHWPMIDEPERVERLVVAFIRSQLSNGGEATA